MRVTRRLSAYWDVSSLCAGRVSSVWVLQGPEAPTRPAAGVMEYELVRRTSGAGSDEQVTTPRPLTVDATNSGGVRVPGKHFTAWFYQIKS